MVDGVGGERRQELMLERWKNKLPGMQRRERIGEE